MKCLRVKVLPVNHQHIALCGKKFHCLTETFCTVLNTWKTLHRQKGSSLLLQPYTTLLFSVRSYSRFVVSHVLDYTFGLYC